MAASHIIDNLEAGQSPYTLIDMDFSWPRYQMIDTIDNNLQNIILRIIDDAEKRQPRRLNLITQFE
jgi:hypothetical protein